jgi:hypothetical protein
MDVAYELSICHGRGRCKQRSVADPPLDAGHLLISHFLSPGVEGVGVVRQALCAGVGNASGRNYDSSSWRG